MYQPPQNFGYVQPAPEPVKSTNWVVCILIGVLCIGIGFALGALITNNKPVPVTPPACTQFAHEADQMNSLSAEGFTIVSQIFQGIQSGDSDKINSEVDKFTDLSKIIQAERTKYDETKDNCLNN